MKIRAANLWVFIALLFLTACGGTLSITMDMTETPEPSNAATIEVLETRIATLQAPPPQQPARLKLDLAADSDTIRAALLDSHRAWETVWADGTITDSLPGGGSTSERVQIWVDQNGGLFRVMSGPEDGEPLTLQVSDGTYQERVNLTDISTQTQQVSTDARAASWQAPREVSDNITPHPLDLEIDSRIGEVIFPSGLAQRGGSYTPTGLEKIAGRSTLMVEWRLDHVMRDRFWIDTQTGLILRWDSYGKPAGSDAGLVSSVVIDALSYDEALPGDLFALQLGEPPRFALDASGDSGPAPEPPPAVFEPGAGELYFVINRAPNVLTLARLPGPCVMSEEICPRPEAVEGFPNEASNIHPLVWAPAPSEGEASQQAALVHDGVLYVYTPASEEWKAAAQFPILPADPLWSPDGDQLVFTAQDADERQDLYAVQPDGSNLQNLTNGLFHDQPGNLTPQGWTADGRLVLSHTAGNIMQPYLLRVGEPQAELVPYRAFRNGIMAVAPDRQQMAYSNMQNSTAEVYLSLVDQTLPGENEPRRVAAFQNASVQQILWSPDGERLVFLVAGGSSPSEIFYTVYSMRTDGSDMRVVFTQPGMQRLTFAGDQHLISEGTNNGRLYLIAIDSGEEPRLIHAPGLRLDQPLLGVSWR